MTITRKTTYALRVLAGMARDPVRPHSVAQMVDSEGIPKAYLAAILNLLVRHGLVTSRRGPSGGYLLALRADDISLARVVEVLEGPLFPIFCLGARSQPCLDCKAGCVARWALGIANRAAWQALESIHLSDLAESSDGAGSDSLPIVDEAPQEERSTATLRRTQAVREKT